MTQSMTKFVVLNQSSTMARAANIVKSAVNRFQKPAAKRCQVSGSAFITKKKPTNTLSALNFITAAVAKIAN